MRGPSTTMAGKTLSNGIRNMAASSLSERKSIFGIRPMFSGWTKAMIILSIPFGREVVSEVKTAQALLIQALGLAVREKIGDSP